MHREGASETPERTSGRLGLFLETLYFDIWRLIKLNFLFLLGCLPLVTLPAAITALHYAAQALLRRRSTVSVGAAFLHAFKREFFRSFLLLPFLLAAGFGLYAGFAYASLFQNGWMYALQCVFYFLAAAFSVTGISFCAALLAAVDLPAGAVLCNTLRFLLTSTVPTLPALGFGLLLWAAVLAFLPGSLLLVLTICFSALGLAYSVCILPLVERYVLSAGESARNA